MRRLKLWSVSQLVDEGKLTMLVDADAPKRWAWRWLLLRSEVEALAAAKRPGARDGEEAGNRRCGWLAGAQSGERPESATMPTPYSHSEASRHADWIASGAIH